MSGPSKYDALARDLTTGLNADAVVLLVFGGIHGNGACPALRLSGDSQKDAELKAWVVRALRLMADGLEQNAEPGHVDWSRDVS